MRRTARKPVDVSESVKYRTVADQLLETACALRDLGDEAFANGLAIISVHAAIAMCDAVTVRVGGCKSSSGDHEDAAALLADTVADIPPAALRGLRIALQEKTAVSYAGRVYSMEKARRLLDGVVTFFDWARNELRR